MMIYFGDKKVDIAPDLATRLIESGKATAVGATVKDADNVNQKPVQKRRKK